MALATFLPCLGLIASPLCPHQGGGKKKGKLLQKNNFLKSVLEVYALSFLLFSFFTFPLNNTAWAQNSISLSVLNSAMNWPLCCTALQTVSTAVTPHDCTRLSPPAIPRSTGPQGPASPSGRLPRPAHQHHLGDCLDMYLLRPHPWPTGLVTGRGPRNLGFHKPTGGRGHRASVRTTTLHRGVPSCQGPPNPEGFYLESTMGLQEICVPLKSYALCSVWHLRTNVYEDPPLIREGKGTARGHTATERQSQACSRGPPAHTSADAPPLASRWLIPTYLRSPRS